MADRFVNELDGVSIVTKAMKAGREDVELQDNASRLFFVLANKEELRGELVKRGAVSAVALALEHHSEDEEFKTWASRFMKRVFS